MSVELHTQLNAMAERAQRQLDGMTINRDAMARDVLTLVKLVRAMKAQAEAAARSPRGAPGGMAGEFERMFDDLFSRATASPDPGTRSQGDGGGR